MVFRMIYRYINNYAPTPRIKTIVQGPHKKDLIDLII